ncbi:MAG: HAMP domain-containing sensor histidine kinase [Planctomycetota bacterium]
MQCVWLEWRTLRGELVDAVASDLFEGAVVDIVPSASRGDHALGGRLASLPAVLVVRGLAPPSFPVWSTTRVTLLAGWTSVVAAAIAVAVLLSISIRTSERRDRFVQAVTHELRTPLTTFCMYSEMLADDVVRDEETRREYLRTLVSESARLRRIVENVLQYARVERSRGRTERERVSVVELVNSVVPLLERRAEESGALLTVDLGELDPALLVAVDRGVVEQILQNLVDNACKYGTRSTEEPARVELRVGAERGRVHLVVRDHGDGVPKERARDVFRAFERAAPGRGDAVPGIGLGLTLAREWARELGGDLELREAEGVGAAFALSLPLAGPGPARW